jgi:hypothetical protein
MFRPLFSPEMLTMTTPKAIPTPSALWAEIMAFVTMVLSWFHLPTPPAPVAAVFASNGIAPEAIPSWLWTILLGLLAKTPALITVVEADIAAGKTFLQILGDIVTAMLGPNPPLPPPAPTPPKS